MELWIRSQDKRTLLKANRIDVDDTDIICWDNDYRCSETYMGKYKTQKRALEVLDEIQLTAVMSGIPFREAEEEYKKRNMNVKDRVLLNYKTGGTLYIMPKE